MKFYKDIKKILTALLITLAFGLIPLSASAHPFPGRWSHHHRQRWHHWHRHANTDAALGILAVGAVAGVIIGAVANSNQSRHCWTEIHHHTRYRYCDR